MKKIILLLIVLFSRFYSIAAETNIYAVLLQAGPSDDVNTHRVFDNKVNIRTEPNITSKILCQASMGELVTIINRTDVKETIYDINAYWYYIEYNSVKGYLWGGLISTLEIEADFDGNKTYEILMARLTSDHECSIGDYMAKFQYNFKLCTIGKIITEKPFGVNNVYKPLSLFKIEDVGFRPNIALLELSSSFGDGGTSSYSNDVFYLKNNEFTSLCRIYEYTRTDPESGKILDSEKCEIQFPINTKRDNTIFVNTTILKDDGKLKTEQYSLYFTGKDFITK